MPRKETLSQFAKNLHKFSPAIIKRILRDWQNYTEESFHLSQNRVPILTGDLQRSGGIKVAKITSKGIESSIIYNLPYAQVIESGIDRNSNPIVLRPQGFEYPHATKAREGQFRFLAESVADEEKNVLDDLERSIEQAWELI